MRGAKSRIFLAPQTFPLKASKICIFISSLFKPISLLIFNSNLLHPVSLVYEYDTGQCVVPTFKMWRGL